LPDTLYYSTNYLAYWNNIIKKNNFDVFAELRNLDFLSNVLNFKVKLLFQLLSSR